MRFCPNELLLIRILILQNAAKDMIEPNVSLNLAPLENFLGRSSRTKNGFLTLEIIFALSFRYFLTLYKFI